MNTWTDVVRHGIESPRDEPPIPADRPPRMSRWFWAVVIVLGLTFVINLVLIAERWL